MLSSPYTRAQQTAMEALRSAGVEDDAVARLHDERLREREFGSSTASRATGSAPATGTGRIRAFLGKIYHRPPGGESWADVGLRVRNVVDMVCREFPDERVLLVTHEVVVLIFRYVLQALTEAQVLALSYDDPIAHCSVTTFRYDPDVGRRGGMRLESANVVEPLVEEGAPVTPTTMPRPRRRAEPPVTVDAALLRAWPLAGHDRPKSGRGTCLVVGARRPPLVRWPSPRRLRCARGRQGAGGHHAQHSSRSGRRPAGAAGGRTGRG